MTKYSFTALSECTPAARAVAERAGCRCPEATEVERSGEFDAYFCCGCRVWLEESCVGLDDEGEPCCFCTNRPPRAPEESNDLV